MSITANVYAKARSEIIALFSWNADSLSPDQSLRLDCAVALRLALDDLQGRIVRGESIDVARMLTAAEALGRILPPTVLASPPPTRREDPREYMLRTYQRMRKRGEIPPEGLTAARIAELEAKVAELEAAGAPAPDELSAECAQRCAPPPTPAAPSNVVPLQKPPSAPAAPAAPKYDYGREQGWKSFVNPDGSIRSTPRGGGHDWGPV
jgi:hypothetical protein